ncbi:hypothetical protein JI76_28605 [Streptomyces anulatus]|uniref:hypothetical protein n=1 Tax=Streptomyces anulatus TaxID=1892 RepID=UPI0006DB0B81|nr:hypothetical protein [Streptomyces anulatus]KPL29084.1 hypothetical protein JI76_28605 [Streptomyces anulatus]
MDTTCTHCETPDPTGSALCIPCTTRLADQLQQLPRLYEALAAHLAPSMATGQGRGGKGGPAPLPVNGHVLGLRGPGGMADVVSDWLTAVHRDRHLPAPRLAGDALTRLHTAVAGLLAHMPWIATGWPAAGDLAHEIADLHRSATTVVDPDPRPRGRRIGHCPAAHTDGTRCGAVLRLPVGETVARCDWCGTTWPPATWTQLKAWQTEDAAA